MKKLAFVMICNMWTTGEKSFLRCLPKYHQPVWESITHRRTYDNSCLWHAIKNHL